MGGDVSSGEQVTVPGAAIPALSPDLLVLESTYGGRRHADREKEVARLLEQVEEVMSRRGAVLFPAFAVGRAQELIVLLAEAIERDVLPRVPVFVDGMVRTVCPSAVGMWHMVTSSRIGYDDASINTPTPSSTVAGQCNPSGVPRHVVVPLRHDLRFSSPARECSQEDPASSTPRSWQRGSAI